MKGTFWRRNVSVPVGFIGRADDTGVYLTVTKDAVARHGWTALPPTVREHAA